MAPSFTNNNTVAGGRMMGKSRKFSKGSKSFGFVPDNRVETMGESEGYGSSGRIDERTASEDSCAPSRKRVNLGKGQFGVPMHVLKLARMSKFERDELRVRLERELEQVRSFQKSIEFSRNTVGPASHAKKRGPPGRNGNGGVGSKNVTGSLLPPATGHAMLMKSCESLLKRLMEHKLAYVFNEPVDPVKLNIPDYFSCIKHPMDFSTVKTKLLSGRYVDPRGFAADIRLTFSNALSYNPKGNSVHAWAETMSKFFEVRWKTIEKKLPVASPEAVVPMRQRVIETETIITSRHSAIETETDIPMPLYKNRHSAITETDVPIPNKNRHSVIESDTTIPMPPCKKKRTSSFESEKKQERVKMTMSREEKEKLGAELEAVLSELPESTIDFLKEANASKAEADEVEIDLDTFSDEAMLKLRKIIDDHLADKKRNSAKAETCEIELHNESGFSNSSMQACEDNEGIEEEVDIGDNDPPISNIPPVEIEKDTAAAGCSSSSSSSDSGSSSSDSDSDSSSESELDGAKAPAIENNKDAEVNMEQIAAVPRDAEDSINVVGQIERKSDSIPVSGEVGGRQEGESAPSERQVSPDKLYRAAVLKDRFADTIRKALEKTNGKVTEQDKERLRLEKEELEKRRKAEKSRLQAEAKAAEEALENAKLAAAAEAKRKRELEREAARQALQKMEKMVDINDNSQFLEDLEMLSVAPAEPLQSLIDETSADGCEDHLGSFNFKGNGNPLEQLGLYMKNDDDDDEDDIEPRSAPTRGADPEEGEID